MTIPRKGRRQVTVDLVDYVYLIPFERSARVVIQSVGFCGAILFVLPFSIMKPSHVANAIRFGRSCGWVPEKKGSDVWLVFDVDSEGRSHFEFVPNNDFRVPTFSTNGKLPGGMEQSDFDDVRPWYLRPSPATQRK